MTLTILGCGTSTGVPLMHCSCKVCRSKHPRNKRLRASVWIQHKGKSLLIDTSTDLRQQTLREKIQRVDAVLYTHPHTDHVAGIDEMRSFNFIQKQRIPVYGHKWTCDELRIRYNYIFNPGPVEGGGIPLLDLHLIEPGRQTVPIAGIPITPLWLKHGSQDCLGYRIDSVAYVTDCSYIPPETLDQMQGLSVLVLDCLKLEKHGTHLNLDQALAVISQVRPKKTYMTHMGHDFDYTVWQKKLPRGVALAYDGLKIKSS